ncbi:MAG: site-specific integrase [Pseudomonadota bacterium]|nr:site-specific integrase [Pseudomonadota bacterium]
MASGTITKRGDSYQLKYEIGRDPTTNRRRRCTETVRGNKKAAEARLRELLNQVDKGTHIDPNKMTVEALCAKFLEYKEPRVAARTHEGYSEILKNHVIPYLGNRLILKINSLDFDFLFNNLAKGIGPNGEERRKLGGRTVSHVHTVSFSAFGFAVQKGFIAVSPMAKVEPPKVASRHANDLASGGAEKVFALDQEQLTSLIKFLEPNEIYILVCFLAATGMRRGEVLASRWKDINFEKSSVSVNRAIECTKKFGTRFKDPKSPSSIRTIGINQNFVGLLRKMKKEAREKAFTFGKHIKEDHLIFYNPEWLVDRDPLATPKPLNPGGVSKAFTRGIKDLGFTGFSLHGLRHTHATLLLNNGVPVNAVAKRLGHAKPSITWDIYGRHVLKDADAMAIEVSGFLLAGI